MNPFDHADPNAFLHSDATRRTIANHDLPCRKGAMVYANTDTQTIVIVPVTCLRWDCPECGPRKAAAYARKLAAAKVTSLLTLTRPSHLARSPRQSYEAMKHAFPRLIRRMRERWGPLEYAAVWEFSTPENLHLHVLLRAPFIPQRWLSPVAKWAGFGHVVDIRPVNSTGGAARYVTKYLMKNIATKHHPFYIKKWITSSRRFYDRKKDPDPDEKPSAWHPYRTGRNLDIILQSLQSDWHFLILPTSTVWRITLHWPEDYPYRQDFLTAVYDACQPF